MNMPLLFAATEGAEKAAESSEGLAALDINPAALGAQLITFLVLFYVVKKYALKGIVANLEKRHNDINRGLHLTAELDKQKAELDEAVDKALAKARKDADQIIAEAHNESGKIIQAAEESANRKAEEIIRIAEGKIEQDIAQARSGLKAEMAELVVAATESILDEKLDAKKDASLIDRMMKKVGA
jgi:F-type H+-transporting ATPase subunit b